MGQTTKIGTIVGGKPEGNKPLEDIGVHGRIILKFILN
jgi:hypothetical protein